MWALAMLADPMLAAATPQEVLVGRKSTCMGDCTDKGAPCKVCRILSLVRSMFHLFQHASVCHTKYV